MRPKNPTNAWRRFLTSKILLVIELGIIVLFSVALIKEIFRRWEVRQEIQKLEDQISELQNQNTELSGLVAYFQSDYYKEQEARLKLGLQKEGESAISVPVAGNSTGVSGQTATAGDNPANDQLSSPQKWWNYFFAKK